MKRIAQRHPSPRRSFQRAQPIPSSGISSIAKVSHTLDAALAERLEEFAFRLRISESSVIEFALRQFFSRGDDRRLGAQLLRSGAARRRRINSELRA